MLRGSIQLAGLFVALTMVGTLVAEDNGLNRRQNDSAARRQHDSAASAKPGERLREGSRLTEVAGTFQFAGDRIAFHPEGSNDSLRVLENLALERVGRIIAEGRGTQMWVVNGQVTEYRGSNYLLVTKAVVRLRDDTLPGSQAAIRTSPIAPSDQPQ